jgi:2-polyprenyl-3-methyl-5-hydroxy-6-metoxy-1,4-benzoquinol methylase
MHKHTDQKVIAAEIRHGQWLLENDPVLQWGWGTPAGKLRAQRRGRLIAEGAGLRPGMRALEIGCGSGLFTEMFAAYGAHILAVDLSRDLLNLAAERKLPPEQVAFLVAPFEECAVQGEGSFDAVIGSSVLHHLDIRAAFDKIHALLKPAGVMSFCEPNMLNPQVWFTLRFRRFFPYMSPDETAFYRRSLRAMLIEAHFTDVSIQPFDWLHPRTPAGMTPLVQKIGAAFEGTPVIREFAGSLRIVARKPA